MNHKDIQNPLIIKESGWTVDEYMRLPDYENQHFEMVAGRLELRPAPTTTHQRVSYQLVKIFTDSCDSDYIIMFAPVDVILTDIDIRQPDILLVHRSRAHIIKEHAVVGPPDLVVEILSPNSAKRDREMKKETYARYLVPEYWIVDPAHLTVERYVLKQNGEPYTLANMFDADETVCSDRIGCVSFTVKEAVKIM